MGENKRITVVLRPLRLRQDQSHPEPGPGGRGGGPARDGGGPGHCKPLLPLFGIRGAAGGEGRAAHRPGVRQHHPGHPHPAPGDLQRFRAPGGRVFLDAGGDDAGVTALGGLHAMLEEAGYDMLYVINRYPGAVPRPRRKPPPCWGRYRPPAGCGATGLVNNSHLGVETTLETLEQALPFARKTAELTHLPLLYSTAPDFAPGRRGGPAPGLPESEAVCEVPVGVRARALFP